MPAFVARPTRDRTLILLQFRSLRSPFSALRTRFLGNGHLQGNAPIPLFFTAFSKHSPDWAQIYAPLPFFFPVVSMTISFSVVFRMRDHVLSCFSSSWHPMHLRIGTLLDLAHVLTSCLLNLLCISFGSCGFFGASSEAFFSFVRAVLVILFVIVQTHRNRRMLQTDRRTLRTLLACVSLLISILKSGQAGCQAGVLSFFTDSQRKLVIRNDNLRRLLIIVCDNGDNFCRAQCILNQNLQSSRFQLMISIFSPRSSLTIALTLAPLIPTQAPTGIYVRVVGPDCHLGTAACFSGNAS